MEAQYVGSGYHTALFNEFESYSHIAQLEPLIKDIDFACFVGRGLSGTIPASILAYRMNKKLLIVRKEAEKTASHAYSLLEGWLVASYIIVDDFISQGDTMRAILRHVTNAHQNANLPPPIFKAILLTKTESSSFKDLFNDIPIIGA